LNVGDLMEDFRYNAREVHIHSPHKIHVIFDATNLHKMPNNLLSFWRSAENTVVPQTGNIIIISQLSFLKIMTAMVSHVTHLQPVTVSTLDEALALVDQWLEKEARQLMEDSQIRGVTEQ